WNETFDEYVRSIGFRVSSYDPCLYVKVVDGECVLLLVYVDDVLVTGSSAEMIAEVKRQLKSRFEMTDSGKCSFILGIEVVDNADGSVTLSQARYINDILERFGMQDCKPAASPVDISMKLVSSDAMTKLDAPFREAVGALMHLMTSTRPDIAFAVATCHASWRTRKSSTGLRSSASSATFNGPSRTESASRRARTSTFKVTRMPTGLVILVIASLRRATCSKSPADRSRGVRRSNQVCHSRQARPN
ncbi:hypothetical protein HBJ00_22160, partial [Aeromonas veronii]|nr:hypothetical protein [Aeromonas veronii]